MRCATWRDLVYFTYLCLCDYFEYQPELRALAEENTSLLIKDGALAAIISLLQGKAAELHGLALSALMNLSQVGESKLAVPLQYMTCLFLGPS